MWSVRVLIFGIPLAALSVAGWAGWRSKLAHAPSPERLVVMMPGRSFAFNPLTPESEAERQVLDLLHEPLVRLGSDGRLQPALAEQWVWHKRLTCWFHSSDLAKQAATRLEALRGNPWVGTQIESAVAEGAAMVLTFTKPDDPGADEALRLIRDLEPLPLAVVRIAVNEKQEKLVRAFSAKHQDLVKRLWFDGAASMELIVSVQAPVLQKALSQWLWQRNVSSLEAQPVGALTGLVEPFLQFHLRAEARWPDGTPLSVEDIRATLDVYLRSQTAPPGMEAIQSIEPGQNNIVRVGYRSRGGSGLAEWTQMPILSAAWLSHHSLPWAEPPPGLGMYRLKQLDHGDWILEKAEGTTATGFRQIHLVPDSPDLETTVGLRLGAIDVAWPQSGDGDIYGKETPVETPARNRLLVLWNTHSSVLSDVRVRSALGLAVDRQSLAKQWVGEVTPISSGVFSPHVWYDPPAPKAVHDLSKARQLLNEAGWLQDVSGVAKTPERKLSFELLTVADNGRRWEVAERLASQWRRAGAEVRVTAVASNELLSHRLRPGAFDAVLIGMDYDVSWDKTALWHSGGSLNFSQLADPRLDVLLDALAGEYDLARVGERAAAVQNRLLDLHAFIPLASDHHELYLRRGRFPDIAAGTGPFQLRALFRQGSTRARPNNLKMIVPDE